MEEVRKNQGKNHGKNASTSQGKNRGKNASKSQGKKDAWKDMFRDSTMIYAADLIKHPEVLLAYKTSAKLTDAELMSIREDLKSGDYERVAAAVENMGDHYKKLKNMKK
ncbi:unnamed protein product [Caenorhabditis nigoni]|uniref:Uncharacterized protein n=1 Tax=Caenorhabditis nigoni TaxID=1611254 RepID=A0A2G5SB63_9PELO|nr:hypothetical protein B9Z55_028613 [Caenorhabditis nigoni]